MRTSGDLNGRCRGIRCVMITVVLHLLKARRAYEQSRLAYARLFRVELWVGAVENHGAGRC